MTRTGVYPGTFDPITLGHMDIIRRGAHLVDRLVIGVTTNPSKSPMFSVEERIAMVEREVQDIANGAISVVSFDSLLMDFATREGASMILRGLRAVADFEYEYQMAGMNQQLNDRIETVFLMADVSLQPIASRLVKEIALY
ncbi:MAG: pantetheine-phosphate adenylyltransferase, partial [Pseudomonadota bacterium]|nr:pantetheine-phosphate adenylyltransferase [Pseudomonadota bacterium]